MTPKVEVGGRDDGGDAELSYGQDAPRGSGALTLYVALADASGDRTWRLGSRPSLDSGFTLSTVETVATIPLPRSTLSR